MFKGLTDKINTITHVNSLRLPHEYTINEVMFTLGDISVAEAPLVTNATCTVYYLPSAVNRGYKICEIDSNGVILREIKRHTAVDISEVNSATYSFNIENTDTFDVAIIAIQDQIVNTLQVEWTANHLKFIDDPISILIYLLKQQNGGANLKISGEGSFNSPNLDRLRSLKIARQITDKDKAYTDALIQSLCEECCMVHYIDENGYDCVKDTLYKEEDCQTEITFYDIIPNSIGKMAWGADPVSGVIIKYGYDYATGEFLGTDDLGQEGLFEDGVELNNTETVELQWLAYGTNAGDRTALMAAMLKQTSKYRQKLSITYEKGRNLQLMQQVKIVLPHETDNTSIQCVIIQIDKDFEGNKVDLDLILLDKIETSFFFEE